MGLVSGLVTNYGYNQVLKLMDGNIEVAKQHLTTYFLEHDQEITAEQASYLANLSMQALQTGGQILTHQVAAKKFATVRGAAKKSDPAQGTAKKSDSAQGAAKKSDPVRVTAKKSDPAQGAAKKSDPVKKESNLRPAENAYELAKARKLQGDTYKNYLHRPEGALKRSIRSLQRSIEEHCNKIADPQSYDSAWHTYPKDRQRRVLRRWKGEIKTFTEQKDIFEGILKNRD